MDHYYLTFICSNKTNNCYKKKLQISAYTKKLAARKSIKERKKISTYLPFFFFLFKKYLHTYLHQILSIQCNRNQKYFYV